MRPLKSLKKNTISGLQKGYNKMYGLTDEIQELRKAKEELWDYIRELEMEIVNLKARNLNLESENKVLTNKIEGFIIAHPTWKDSLH